GEAIGVIALLRGMVRPFEPRQIELVETFADQAAIAIENVRLFNETKEALERQTAIGEVLSVLSRPAFELEPMLKAVSDNAKRLTGASVAVIWRVQGEVFELAAASAMNPAWIERYRGWPTPLDEGFIVRNVVRSRARLHASAAGAEADTQDARFSAELGNYHTALGVPLVRDDQIVGVLSLTREDIRAFSDREIEIVRNFADQAVIAIENVRLFNETKEALEQQTATANVLKTISRSAFNLQSVFDVAGDDAHRRCPYAGQPLHRRGDPSRRDLRRSGRDRDRERPSVQRDQGGTGAPDRPGRDPAGDLPISDRHAAGVRGDCARRRAVLRRGGRGRPARRKRSVSDGRARGIAAANNADNQPALVRADAQRPSDPGMSNAAGTRHGGVGRLSGRCGHCSRGGRPLLPHCAARSRRARDRDDLAQAP